MRTRRTTTVALLGATALAAAGGIAVAAGTDDENSAALAGKIDSSRPKNVILLVGDGMGSAEQTLARYYAKGAAGRMNMDRLAFRGTSIHYVLRNGPGPSYKPNYVGDSAPTATAWSTGKRTSDGRLSQGPSTADNVPGSNAGYATYMEIAKARGKAVGNVTTSDITDATPAAPSSHISLRACKGPADARTTCPTETKAAGGLGSIAEQQVDHDFDVYLGGGAAFYSQPLASGTTGPTVVDYAQGKGYDYVTNTAGLNAVTSLDGGKKVLGLFAPVNLTTEYAPLFARTDAFLNPQNQTPPGPARTDQSVNGGDPVTGSRCTEGNRPAAQPSLPLMTEKAIALLDDDPQGFTLQVEGASIDKRDHAADVCGQIGETVAFDDAVGVALDYQRDHPDTLVLMTADHAHTSLMINAEAKPATGTSYATLKTADDAPIRVAYGTQDTGSGATTSGSQAHTGAEVAIWGTGPQAANVVGTLDQTDIFSLLNGKTPSSVAGGGSPGSPGAPGAPGTPGTPGTPGGNGSNGTNGTNGTNGVNGAAGSNGTPGAKGETGANGTPGAKGDTGATGSPGRDGTVTCRITGNRSRVTCTVSYSSSRSATSARLVRRGKTVATARLVRGKVTFAEKVAKGRYTLVAAGRSTRLTFK